MLESQGSLAEWTPLGQGGKHVPRVMPLLMSLDYQSGKVMAVGSLELHRRVLPKQAQRLVSALACRGGPRPHGPSTTSMLAAGEKDGWAERGVGTGCLLWSFWARDHHLLGPIRSPSDCDPSRNFWGWTRVHELKVGSICWDPSFGGGDVSLTRRPVCRSLGALALCGKLNVRDAPVTSTCINLTSTAAG